MKYEKTNQNISKLPSRSAVHKGLFRNFSYVHTLPCKLEGNSQLKTAQRTNEYKKCNRIPSATTDCGRSRCRTPVRTRHYGCVDAIASRSLSMNNEKDISISTGHPTSMQSSSSPHHDHLRSLSSPSPSSLREPFWPRPCFGWKISRNVAAMLCLRRSTPPGSSSRVSRLLPPLRSDSVGG